MFFVKIEDTIQEFVFDTKKEAIMYIVDFLDRKEFDDPIVVLKNARKITKENEDIIVTEDYTFKVIKIFKYKKCSICEEPMPSNMNLKCNHYVCKDCIHKMRKTECPICRHNLEGNFVTDEMYCKILNNNEIDRMNEENNDMMMALMTAMGYNANELY